MDPPVPLKNKLSHVRDLLEDAGERLREEAAKCPIFATKSSASAASGSNMQLHQQQAFGNHYVPQDLIRTISDISTLKTVFSCPIFNRIVNVTDSLDKLSYHLNLHPSIGPSDINIDAEGELILAPPFEPTSLNNLINSKLDEFSDHSNSSPRIISPNNIHNNNLAIINDHHMKQQMQPANFNGSTELDPCNGGFAPFHHQQQQQQSFLEHNANLANQQLYDKHIQSAQNFVVPPSILSSLNSYDTEKLVSNGTCKTYLVCNKAKHDATTKMGTANSNQNGCPKVIKSDGDFALGQIAPDSIDFANGFNSSPTQVCDYTEDSRGNGYSNEMYETTYELNSHEIKRTPHQKTHLESDQNNGDTCMKNVQSLNSPTNGRIQSLQGSNLQHNRSSCSPSTSAGSTVRLADDCESGASSYQSQNAKVAPYTPYHKPTVEGNFTRPQHSEEERVESMEQELIENLSPEMERIKVKLEKDDGGLGITIAGYTCETEEISGIFIKSITPNSPADRSGKIRTLDQIFSVNGRELLGYSNPEAVHVLKHTGRVVTLELMRYLAESKYRKLQTALAHAVPTMNTSASRLSNQENAQTSSNGAQNSTNLIMSPTKSSIPVFKTRENLNLSPIKSSSPILNKPTLVQVSNGQQHTPTEFCSVESIYKNEFVNNNNNNNNKSGYVGTNLYSNQMTNSSSPDSQGHIPVAAQRTGSNKVIETLQGPRNTIDIRSPACQATYVNKIVEMEHDISKKSLVNRLQNESMDEFGQIINRGWEKDAQIIELHKDTSQGLGFTVKEYTNPKEQKQSIIMIYSITPGGIAERDGRLSKGDLLIFVDDTNLEGASLQETVKALRKTNGQVRLGVLKLKQQKFDAQE